MAESIGLITLGVVITALIVGLIMLIINTFIAFFKLCKTVTAMQVKQNLMQTQLQYFMETIIKQQLEQRQQQIEHSRTHYTSP